MIKYLEKCSAFKLDTKCSSYVLGVSPDGYLLHIHYGGRVNDEDIEYMLPRRYMTAFTACIPDPAEDDYSLETTMCEYPCSGTGDPRRERLLGDLSFLQIIQNIQGEVRP